MLMATPLFPAVNLILFNISCSRDGIDNGSFQSILLLHHNEKLEIQSLLKSITQFVAQRIKLKPNRFASRSSQIQVQQQKKEEV